MLMGHPPQIIARGREDAPQGCFEGLTPVQVPIVVQELVACDAEVEKALADPLEAVQKIAQAGPQAFHRVAVHTRAVRVTPSILAGSNSNFGAQEVLSLGPSVGASLDSSLSP